MPKFRASKKSGKFCKPNCKVKKPSSEFLEEFETTYQAILNSYLPCNVCKPLNTTNKTPKYISDVLNEVLKNPYKPITKKEILLRGFNYDKLNRWFKLHHSYNFQEFQQIILLNKAFHDIYRKKQLKLSKNINDDFRSVFGDTKTSDNGLINIDLVKTPIGPMYVCADKNGIILLEFTNHKKILSDLRKIVNSCNSSIRFGFNNHIKKLKTQLNEYFEAERKQFDIKLNLIGTDFQKNVWQSIMKLDYGKLFSFKQVSDKMDSEVSARAVATAVSSNPLRLVIPCHRIISSKGKLLGYAGGKDRKKWLIDFEKAAIGESVQKSINFYKA